MGHERAEVGCWGQCATSKGGLRAPGGPWRPGGIECKLPEGLPEANVCPCQIKTFGSLWQPSLALAGALRLFFGT